MNRHDFWPMAAVVIVAAIVVGSMVWGGINNEKRLNRECAALLATSRDARDSLRILQARPSCARLP